MRSDFGAWRGLNSNFIVRYFGNEHTFTPDELTAFVGHLQNVLNGAEKSVGEDYLGRRILNSIFPTPDLLTLLSLTPETTTQPKLRRL